jgi:hypothetical protein
MEDYQQKVLGLPGAMGPTTTAYWPMSTTNLSDPYSLSSQPLYINNDGMYTPSYDKGSDYYNISNAAFGKKAIKEFKKRSRLSKRLKRLLSKKNKLNNTKKRKNKRT